MTDDEAWKVEESLWLQGIDVFREMVHGDCIMAFAAPVGIMKGAEIARSLKDAPRWASVVMSRRTIGRPDSETLCLAYHALGSRERADPYQAVCTSTYRHGDDGWKLIQHQQTPQP